MKRQILSLATALVLTTGGAIFAQSTLNTQAPGPSQETKPGQTNNNLQNPGSKMQQQPTTTTTTAPVTETTTTDSNSGTMNNDTTMTPPAPPVDTTTTAPVDTTTTAPAYNSNSGSSVDTTTTTTSTRSLPKTASELPTVALMGLLALSAFFAVRVLAKRNA
jgi:cobalamin biosynthesis Mg chelatase CobN